MPLSSNSSLLPCRGGSVVASGSELIGTGPHRLTQRLSQSISPSGVVQFGIWALPNARSPLVRTFREAPIPTSTITSVGVASNDTILTIRIFFKYDFHFMDYGRHKIHRKVIKNLLKVIDAFSVPLTCWLSTCPIGNVAISQRFWCRDPPSKNTPIQTAKLKRDARHSKKGREQKQRKIEWRNRACGREDDVFNSKTYFNED